MRTSTWSVLESTLICWRASAMARPAVWVLNSRRACLAAVAISCSAASTTLRKSSSVAFWTRASSALASLSAVACMRPISTSSCRKRFSISAKRRLASWLAARASSKACWMEALRLCNMPGTYLRAAQNVMTTMMAKFIQSNNRCA